MTPQRLAEIARQASEEHYQVDLRQECLELIAAYKELLAENERIGKVASTVNYMLEKDMKRLAEENKELRYILNRFYVQDKTSGEPK